MFAPTQVEEVNSIMKPEIEETLLHATASVGSILCAKLLLEVRFVVIKKDSCPWQRFWSLSTQLHFYDGSTFEVGARTDVWDLDGHSTPLHAAATAETNAAKMVGY